MSGVVSAGAPQMATPDLIWTVFHAWLRRAHAVVSASAAELNRMNVFPISDADTGTNVELTLAGILDALPADGRAGEDLADEVVQAAVLSAHGNSGAIVAEMLIRVSRELLRPAELSHSSRGGARGPLSAGGRRSREPGGGQTGRWHHLDGGRRSSQSRRRRCRRAAGRCPGRRRRGRPGGRPRAWPAPRCSWPSWPTPGSWTPAVRRTSCCSRRSRRPSEASRRGRCRSPPSRPRVRPAGP